MKWYLVYVFLSFSTGEILPPATDARMAFESEGICKAVGEELFLGRTAERKNIESEEMVTIQVVSVYCETLG